MKLILFALLLVFAAPATTAQPADEVPAETETTWVIDTNHSELSFRVRHLLSRVRGTFRTWEGSLTGSPDDWSTGSVSVLVDASSIDTNHERRDNHLRSDDFFDVTENPNLIFESTRFEVDGENVRVHGNLTMRGVTHPVVLEGTYLGSMPDARGGTRVGFEAETTVNRLDYDINWNRAVEAGGVVLGDEVTITINIQAVSS